jgi:hypothetical protein
MKFPPETVPSNAMAAALTTSVHRQEKERYLILCPTHRDDRELGLLVRPGLSLIRHDYASLALEEIVATSSSAPPTIADPLDEIERILDRVSNETIAGVVSTDDYPGSTLACVVAKRLGLPGTEPSVNLICQHKYYSRLAQRAIVPEAVPEFELVHVDGAAALLSTIRFPAFLKPVKSFFSVGAQRLNSLDQLTKAQKHWAGLATFFHPFERLLERYASRSVGTGYLLIESLLQGVQTTLEGHAFGGKIHILGVVDSVMFPGTLAFERFEYPSSLPIAVQDRMARIAQSLMAGLGFRNGLFNIEFMYDPLTDALNIIEINPRMASQFADLYEKVDGFNTYTILLDLAAGREPCEVRGQGLHRMAASCVLRTFQDKHVLSVPSLGELAVLSDRFPDIRIEVLASVGRTLSQEMQDDGSFRYGIVNLGGRDRQDVLEKFDECRRRMKFVLAPIDSERPEQPDPSKRLNN